MHLMISRLFCTIFTKNISFWIVFNDFHVSPAIFSQTNTYNYIFLANTIYIHQNVSTVIKNIKFTPNYNENV